MEQSAEPPISFQVQLYLIHPDFIERVVLNEGIVHQQGGGYG
jgi:hypothetical protein